MGTASPLGYASDPIPEADDITRDASPRTDAEAGVGGVVAGRYRLSARLGRGGAKTVFLAYDARLDREVAVALVPGDGQRERVVREAHVTGRLGDHPHVITVYDTGEHDGVPFLVLRAMGGGSLAAVLETGRVGAERAVRIGREIALALAHAHRHGIVHRDVKPANVWLAADGSAALGDFGVAVRRDPATPGAAGIVGTVRYVAPEVVRGEDAGPAADLYALGITLYELVTGRTPFGGTDTGWVLAQHLSAEPDPPSWSGVPVAPALERLILELLAKDPARRPASAEAVAAALERIAPEAARAADARRMVTVVAVRADDDDPEVLHDRLDRCAAVVAEHGGTAQWHLGTALMAFFGLAGSAEGDAVRAAEAALALRATVQGVRLGAEVGELFVRGPAVTGAAVTVAAGLAETAPPGEVVLGERLREVLAPDARLDAASGHLVAVRADDTQQRTPPTPLVGRAAELERLRATLRDVEERRRPALVTVLGAAGLGKSRLVRELAAEAGRSATVLLGHCRRPGEGTTVRVLAELLGGLGEDPAGRVRALLAGDERAIRAVCGAAGLTEDPVQPEEAAWAVRRLLEALAVERPVLVGVEDVHWADPALLDLLEHVAARAGDAAVLLVCLARPSLLDARPSWTAPWPGRTVVELAPLGAADGLDLAVRLGVGVDRARRICARAEGNPLFIEQLVAVAGSDGDGELPASVHSVLAARLDSLQPDERALLQHGAVQGRTFHAGAVAAALGREAGVATDLRALARKGLVDPDRSEFGREAAFRFTHALLRDAAYAGLPKRARAGAHAAVAGWLVEHPGAADEVVAHHLEQAWWLHSELGDPVDPAVAAEARARLRRAARADLARGVPGHAGDLLERAVALAGPDDAALLTELGAARFEAGGSTAAAELLDAAIARARDPVVAANARVEREIVRLETEPGADTRAAEALADAVLPVVAAAGDERGQARAWMLRGAAEWPRGQVAAAAAAWTRALACSQAAQDERGIVEAVGWCATAAVLGPEPVPAAIARCEALRGLVVHNRLAEAWIVNSLACLHAMRGDLAAADRRLAAGRAILADLGTREAGAVHLEAIVALVAGVPARVEAPLRRSLEELEAMDGTDTAATTTAFLAQVVLAAGRLEEAERLTHAAQASASADDVITQAVWRGVRARVLGARGRVPEAEGLARAAIDLLAQTDLLSYRGDAMLDLADVLDRAGRPAEAAAAVRDAVGLYERKGNAAVAARARATAGAPHRAPTT